MTAPATALGLTLALAPVLAAAPQGGDEHLVVEGPRPAVIRLGDSAEVVLRVDTRKNPPAPTVPTVAGLRLHLRLLGSEESTSIIHGRRTYRRSVKYILDIHPLREGKFTIPPFEVD
ncbi:MAG: BatD family protein, partial [Planctomycetota bacterium]